VLRLNAAAPCILEMLSACKREVSYMGLNCNNVGTSKFIKKSLAARAVQMIFS